MLLWRIARLAATSMSSAFLELRHCQRFIFVCQIFSLGLLYHVLANYGPKLLSYSPAVLSVLTLSDSAVKLLGVSFGGIYSN